VTVEYRWADGDYKRLPELAADLVRRQVTVIAAIGGTAAVAPGATSTIRCFQHRRRSDPVGTGQSPIHPGTNMTGVVVLSSELAGKRLQLLKELLPSATAFVPHQPKQSGSWSEARVAQEAAQLLGVYPMCCGPAPRPKSKPPSMRLPG
jgi:putative ABC transport system substrate-binding protein